MSKSKIVFIDRDGVINVDPIGDYVKSWSEFRFEPDAIPSLKALCDSGYKIIVISNQAGIGDGVYPETELWDIHKNMLAELEKNGVHIYASHYCLHGKQAGCPCRKPEIGLFRQAVEDLEYAPEQTFFIGDKATDIEAGKRFGIKTIFVRTGHGKTDEVKLNETNRPDHIVETVADAVKVLSAQPR